jgi:hypothetical protein
MRHTVPRVRVTVLAYGLSVGSEPRGATGVLEASPTIGRCCR